MAKKAPQPVDVNVGARVRMRRTMLGLSQTKLADAIGVTFQQVQKYEKGINRIGPSRLHQIAGVLQVPISFFFDGGHGQPTANGMAPLIDYVAQYLSTSDGLALTKAFMKIKDAKLRRSIVNFVNEVAGPEA